MSNWVAWQQHIENIPCSDVKSDVVLPSEMQSMSNKYICSLFSLQDMKKTFDVE